MRKDVERLQDIYSLAEDDARSDFAVLGWPNAVDVGRRFEALLSAIDFGAYSRQKPLRLLDVGCGLGLLLDWLKENGHLPSVDYTGADLSSPMLQAAFGRWPAQRFELRDIRDQPYAPDCFDFCIISGIFTANNGNSYDETQALARELLKAIWPSVRLGLAFNSMSKHVDWERDDLHHWPLDDIMAFCKRELSRHVTFKLDYGLWEVATIVRRQPLPMLSKTPARWGQ
jgi:SAM-dependent methyltransferase